VAVLGPAAASARTARIETLLRSGIASWGGGKPRGLSRPVRLARGPTIASTIVRDRR